MPPTGIELNNPYRPYRPIERTIAIRVPLREATVNTLNTNKASYNPVEPSKEGRLIYYIDKAIGVRRLYILATIIKDILTIVYTTEGYIGFARYYERIVGL